MYSNILLNASVFRKLT